MEFKTEHIIVIVLVLLVAWLILGRNSENFNVLEDRWAYPLTNEAGDLWTREFDRPVTYSYPDGRLAYIPQPTPNIPKSIYKEEIYDGAFEIPEFNYEEMPVPKKMGNVLDVDESEGDFVKGVAYNKMPDSDSQQHYYHLKRQMQTRESCKQETESFSPSSYEDNDQYFSTRQPLEIEQVPQIQQQMQQLQQMPRQMPQQIPQQMQQEMPQQKQMINKPHRPMIPQKNVMYVKRKSNFSTIILILVIIGLLYYIYSKK